MKMEQRYHHQQLFKSDVPLDQKPASPPAPAPSQYQYASNNNNSSNSRPTTGTASQQTTNPWNHTPKWKHILGEESVAAVKGSNLSTSTNQQQSASSQLHSAINNSLSLRVKCDHITRLLTSFSNKDLIDIFPQLLVEIFAFSGSDVFGLNKFEPRRYSYDFSAAFSFLSTGGCLFKTINKLMVDQDALFHFPYQGLPAGLVEKMKTGQISLWYQNKLVALPGNEVVLACNALEYYLLLFAYYIIHPRTLQQSSQWSGVEDVLYVRLLEDYLNYFLPVDANKHTNNAMVSPQRKLDTSSASNLWKSPGSRVQSDSNAQSTVLQYIQPSSHAEIFLQLLCDIWLGLNAENQTEQEQVYKLPSVDHARVVRIVVKYVHVFVNGNNSLQTVLFNATHPEHIEQLKCVVIPAMMQKSLYLYLQHCFTHWPLDASFRMIMETWLSYIQPWRYRENYVKTTNDTITADVIDISQWKQFVGDNLLFYSSIFQMFLLRALRFDMTSLHDIQLVYRVAKVFSQASLIEILQEGTDEATPANVRSPSLYLSFTPSSRKLVDKTSDPLTSVFNVEVTKHVEDLCVKLGSTMVDLKKKCGEAKANKQTSGGGGILHTIKEFFFIDDTTDFDRDRERQRTIDYLDQTVSLLTSTFKLPDVQTSPSVESPLDTSQGGVSGGGALVSSDDSLPEYIISENGIHLTDLGRYQIVQGIRHFPITYSGDPELQPLRTYESEMAVKSFYWLACTLNNKYGHVIDKVYNQSGFLTKILRRFSKRLHTKHYVNTPFHIPQSTLSPSEKVAPRISLRFAGSYYFLGYVCWTVVIARMLGFNWVTIIFVSLILAVVSIVAHVDQPPKKFN